jgi:elongation factor Tu
MPQTREHVLLARQVGVPSIVVFLNKVTWWMMRSCWIWWSWRFGIFLTEYEFPGDEVPVVRGSALKALEGDEEAQDQVMELMTAVDRIFRSRSGIWKSRF